MSEQDRELVQKIADEVLRAMSAQAKPGAPAPVNIAPPAGVCTGDYSKFQELAGKQVGAKSPSAGAGGAAAGQQVVPLTGIVTATALQSAMNASPGGVAHLAPGARLTPLASDLARQFPQRIVRVDNPGAGIGVEDQLPWLWWIDGQCPAVAAVVAQRTGLVSASTAARAPTALAQVVRDLAAAIKGRRVIGGLLFVRSAARAMCFTNRCASIRAVVGTCGEAVEEGVAELGANVLVIEYPHHGERAIAAMVDRMTQQPPRIQPTVERDLSDLHRCG